MVSQENQKKCSILSNSNFHEGETQQLSLPMCLSMYIVLIFFLLIKSFGTLLSIIVRIPFLQSSRARTLSLTISLVAGIPVFYLLDWTLLSGQEPGLASSQCRAGAQINGCGNTFQFLSI